MANYMPGPLLRFGKGAPRSTTFRDIQDAAVAASARLGKGYLLEPEEITEGGFMFTEWPGMQPGQYKTVRFHGFRRWPFLENDAVKGGASAAATILKVRDGNDLGLYLKAFHGAPVFTRAEVVIVAESLAACFDDCRIVRVPSDSRLRGDYKRNLKHRELAGPR